ncbi:MAG: hypothetical protein U9O78_03355 [Patescibacteria group bacterium]|nr:hypothetical protein [Patescibacteria group bacterium]
MIDKRKDFYQAHPMLLPELELLCASQQVDSVEALAYFLAHIHMRSFENKQDEKLYGARRSEVRNRPPIEQMLAVLEITPMRDIYSNSSDVLSNLLSPPPDIFKPESVKSPSSWLMQFAPQEMRQAITEQYALVFEAFHQKIPAVHEGRIPLHLISHNEPEKVGGKKEGVDALLEYAVGLNKPASFYETILPLIIKIYAESQLTQSGKLNTTHFLSGMVAWYQSSISSKGLLNQPFFDKLSMPTQTLDERLNELKKRYNDDKENYSYTNLLRDQE